MLTLMKRLIAGCAMALAIGGASLSISAPAFAADDAKPAVSAPAATPAAAEAPAAPAAIVPNKADTVWMLLSTALVLLMTLPGLSLFYGGLTRSKIFCPS